MPLTTKDASKISTDVVTDVNPADSVAVERAKRVSPDAAILLDKSIIAKPLMVPEVCTINIKNTGYRYRWVNKGSNNGRFYQQRRAQGFINATLDDIDVLGGDAVSDSGSVTCGDLILMKIRTDIYDAAMKYNILKASRATAARGMYLDDASPDVFSDKVAKRQSISNEPYNKSGLAEPFIPTNADALVQDSINAGRAEVTRKELNKMREQSQGQRA